jgi:DNA modification methylase
VEYFTVAGDTVLDLCSGTGTGALTCFLTNRDCVAVELDELQFKLMPSRMLLAYKYVKENANEETGRLKLDGTGEL